MALPLIMPASRFRKKDSPGPLDEPDVDAADVVAAVVTDSDFDKYEEYADVEVGSRIDAEDE